MGLAMVKVTVSKTHRQQGAAGVESYAEVLFKNEHPTWEWACERGGMYCTVEEI